MMMKAEGIEKSEAGSFGTALRWCAEALGIGRRADDDPRNFCNLRSYVANIEL